MPGKLDERQVREVRRLAEKGLSVAILAARFGVRPDNIRKILSGKAYKNVE